MDHIRARGLRVASSSARPAQLSAAAGGLWRGGGALAVSSSRAVQRAWGGQVARLALWRIAPGVATGARHHLSRNVWERALSVRLSAGRIALGHAPSDAGMAFCDGNCGAGRAGLAA